MSLFLSKGELILHQTYQIFNESDVVNNVVTLNRATYIRGISNNEILTFTIPINLDKISLRDGSKMAVLSEANRLAPIRAGMLRRFNSARINSYDATTGEVTLSGAIASTEFPIIVRYSYFGINYGSENPAIQAITKNHLDIIAENITVEEAISEFIGTAIDRELRFGHNVKILRSGTITSFVRVDTLADGGDDTVYTDFETRKDIYNSNGDTIFEYYRDGSIRATKTITTNADGDIEFNWT